MTAGDLGTGARIGRYVIIERVGTGAMGVVYGAYDPELDRKVALKLIKPGQGGVKDTARARLLREAKAIARLQHPNVVAVHDVGMYEDQVFLAMEFVAGGTIKSWLAAQTRSWREIVDVFVAAGRGLAAAHAAGLVHRDFKPDNVLLDKEQRPRVVDFGIARQAGGGDDELAGDTGDVAEDGTATLRDSSGKHALATLTKTGTWVGTPAYMAPEQFLGERGDEKSDQFSFCVALYEALYGERPFAGDDMLSISVNVTTEQLRPMPRDRGVPAWVRRVILRGLKVDAATRWESMAALIRALENDPAVNLRRRAITGGAVVLVAASLIIAWQMVSRRHAQANREIARFIDGANRAVTNAEGKATEARKLRDRAYAAFDAMDRDQGESLWRHLRAMLPAIDGSYDEAERALENALMLDKDRKEIRIRLADLRYQHILLAEEYRLDTKAAVLRERLTSVDHDRSKKQALVAPGTVSFRLSPPSVRGVLERYELDPATGRRDARSFGPLQPGAANMTLPEGSYRLIVDGDALAQVTYPFEVARGNQTTVDLTVPPASAVPDGFVYVPAGEFWYGDADEQLRTQFLDTAPIHRRKTGAYLVARHETTYRDWIAFLDAQKASAEQHLPNVSTATRGWLRLRSQEGQWQLAFQVGTTRYSVRAGEPFHYIGRKTLGRQDWSLFPVAGVSVADMNAYLQWLSRTGRVPGARLCSELEWERVARGGDDRLFPHGDELRPEDANFDVTYGRIDSAYGPDAVGAHPQSRSPFGVEDLAGNVLEVVTSVAKADELVIRGGGYYFGSASARSTNRLPVPSTFRDVTTGIRVCASVQGER